MSCTMSDDRPEPGDRPEAWDSQKGIFEPGTPGIAAAAVYPSKAGGLGSRARTRGRRARDTANATRYSAGRLPRRVGAWMYCQQTRYSRVTLLIGYWQGRSALSAAGGDAENGGDSSADAAGLAEGVASVVGTPIPEALPVYKLSAGSAGRQLYGLRVVDPSDLVPVLPSIVNNAGRVSRPAIHEQAGDTGSPVAVRHPSDAIGSAVFSATIGVGGKGARRLLGPRPDRACPGVSSNFGHPPPVCDDWLCVHLGVRLEDGVDTRLNIDNGTANGDAMAESPVVVESRSRPACGFGTARTGRSDHPRPCNGYDNSGDDDFHSSTCEFSERDRSDTSVASPMPAVPPFPFGSPSSSNRSPPSSGGARMLKLGTDFSGLETLCMALREMGLSSELICSSDRCAHLRRFIESNFGPHHLYVDALTRPGHDLDVYCAGPPCVRFSHLGRRQGEPDPTTSTLEASISHILRDRPRCFVLENVLGLRSFDKGALLIEVANRLRAMGYYEVSVHVLDSRKHGGLPQSRRRVYIIGICWFFVCGCTSLFCL